MMCNDDCEGSDLFLTLIRLLLMVPNEHNGGVNINTIPRGLLSNSVFILDAEMGITPVT